MPQEMYAAASACIGTATTADAVSCEPTATTSALPPSEVATSGSSGPRRSPGVTSAGRMPRGRPSALMSASSHAWSVQRSRPVVEAFVTSARATPVSQYASRSGISSAVSAISRISAGSVTSWYRVLNGRNCRPPRSKSSACGTRSCTVATPRAVRASR